jgi:hypothetical protein
LQWAQWLVPKWSRRLHHVVTLETEQTSQMRSSRHTQYEGCLMSRGKAELIEKGPYMVAAVNETARIRYGRRIQNDSLVSL